MIKFDFLSKFLDGSMIKFQDRQYASEMLYLLLKHKLTKISFNETLILGIPRGGIIIGDILATKFGCSFDIIIPRKLRSQQNKELSIGAIMKDHTLYLDHLLIKKLGVTHKYLQDEQQRQIKEIKRRENILGQQIDTEKIKEKNIIVVDDGSATGATLIVTIRWLRKYKAKYLMVVIPICPIPTLKLLKEEADQVECIICPSLRNFTTVDTFYENFEQLACNELINILKKHKLYS